MYGREEYKSAFGHIATGGGASIKNSPVTINNHYTINIFTSVNNEDEAGLIKKVLKTMGWKRHEQRKIATIETASELSPELIQGQLDRLVQSR
jgi:hypothetical protein